METLTEHLLPRLGKFQHLTRMIMKLLLSSYRNITKLRFLPRDLDHEQLEAHRKVNSVCYSINLARDIPSNLQESCKALAFDEHNYLLFS